MNGESRYIGGVDFKELRAQRVSLYDTITLDLSVARTDEELEFVGTYLYATEGTDIDANVTIRLNERFRKGITITKGRGVRAPFYRLYLTNAAQTGKSITLAIGTEHENFEIIDLGKALEVSGAIKIGGCPTAYYNQVAVGIAATLIRAANANRRSISVQNLDAANNLFLGYDNAVTTATGGCCLPPYASIELYFTGTIYGIRAAGAGNAGYLEEVNT